MAFRGWGYYYHSVLLLVCYTILIGASIWVTNKKQSLDKASFFSEISPFSQCYRLLLKVIRAFFIKWWSDTIRQRHKWNKILIYLNLYFKVNDILQRHLDLITPIFLIVFDSGKLYGMIMILDLLSPILLIVFDSG